jgi:UDP-glucuronate 4-epimerase
LLRFIEILEDKIGKKANLKLTPLQPGDVVNTCADVSKLESVVGELPHTPLEKGLAEFVEWYQEYYKLKEWT